MSFRTINKRRFGLFSTVVFLVVMMVTSAGSVLAQRGSSRSHINLSGEQRQKLQRHIKDNRSKMAGVTREIVQARMEFFGQIREYRVDEKQLQESMRKINALQVKLHNIGLENQSELREILTKEQFAELGEAVSGKGVGQEGVYSWPRGGIEAGSDGLDRLNLSSEQQEKIKKLFERSHATMQSISRELRSNAQSLHKLYLDYDLDTKQAKARIEKLGESQREAIKATIARQIALRDILTQQQFEKLSQTMRPPAGPRRQRPK